METEKEKAGLLILVPTPIGNREDITLRALRCLREADLICCEDTRHTGLLLQHYGITGKRLLSNHEHNEQSRAPAILQHVAQGERVCIVSDAGMPGISDPGLTVLRAAQAQGLPYTVLPGASAGVTAFVASGAKTLPFFFYGFLPRRGSERESILRELDERRGTAILYESPQRIRTTIRALSARWPDRRFALIREWTKAFEEVCIFMGRDFDPASIRAQGEFVVVIENSEESASAVADDATVLAQMRAAIHEGISASAAARQVAAFTGRSRNDVYALWIDNRRTEYI